MKKITTLLVLFMLSFNIYADLPQMSMTISDPIGSTFTFKVKSSVANNTILVYFGNSAFVRKTIGVSETEISGTLVGSQTVTILGTNVVSLNCDKKRVTSIFLSNGQLKELICNDNYLEQLDVSKSTNLITLSCYNNTLKVLDVSKNTVLATLNCSNNRLTTLNLSNNTVLNLLDCSQNQLVALDASKCLALKELNCYSNQIGTLNVTKNKVLTKLECTGNQLSLLNVTNNTALTSLGCGSNKLRTLNVTKNTALTLIWCASNQLTELNISNNTVLKKLYCYSNQISGLNINNTQLSALRCQDNKFTFASFSNFPLNKTWEGMFEYAPQQSVPIANSVAVGTTVDLSKEFTINGNTTTYIWKTTEGAILVEGIDYTFNGGKTTFLTPQSESIYCEMTNALYPSLVLITTNTKVIMNSLKNGNANTSLASTNFEGKISVYPNPAADILNVEGNEIENANVSIFNQTGALVWVGNVMQQKINVSKLPAGVYTLRINKDKENKTVRFIKQ